MGLDALGINLDYCPKDRHGVSYLGRESGECIVCASGHTVWKDLAAIAAHENMHYLCVNDVGMHIPFWVRHWYSNDDEWLPRWVNARRPQYKKNIDRAPTLVHTRQKGQSHMCIWPGPGHGTSALGAVYTALALGYDRVIICGAPLDDMGHYFDPPWIRTNFDRQVPEVKGETKYWTNARNRVFEGRVKAVSGRLRDILG